MSRIDLGQIDDFKKDFNVIVNDGQIAIWNSATEEFEPGDISIPDSAFDKIIVANDCSVVVASCNVITTC